MDKWYDNKAVVFRSTYSSMQSVTTKKRWDAKKRSIVTSSILIWSKNNIVAWEV